MNKKRIIIISLVFLIIITIVYIKSPKNKIDKYKIKYKTIEYTTNNNKGKVITVSHITYPVESKNDNKVTKKIISAIREPILYEWKNNYIKEIDFLTNEYKDEVKINAKNLGLDNKVTTTLSQKNIISFKVTLIADLRTKDETQKRYDYYKIEGYNFSKKTGDLIELKEITNNYDVFLKYIYDESIKTVKEKVKQEILFDDNVNGSWKDIIKDNIQNIPNWYFDEKGINLIIQRGTIATPYDGMKESIIVSINKENINKYLKKEYKL